MLWRINPKPADTTTNDILLHLSHLSLQIPTPNLKNETLKTLKTTHRRQLQIRLINNNIKIPYQRDPLKSLHY